METKKLANGVAMPLIGLGTFLAKGDEVYQAVLCALEQGYRLIDTAQVYHNEEQVGKAIKDSNIKREELFITSKVWNGSQGYQETINAFHESCRKLGVTYLDLYLIHWPKSYEKSRHTWRALEDLYDQKLIRAIGVSNFQVHHLEHLLPHCRILPMMNQIELHPGLQQINLVNFCHNLNIEITSYGPLMKGQVFEMEELKKMAERLNTSIPTIIINWGRQRGIFMIPKSITPERIKDNFRLLTLSEDDMAIIRKLNIARRVYSDPDNIDF